MISVETGINVQSVNVMTSDEGGLTSEQITELALDKIITVSNTAPPEIKEQADVFRENIRHVLLYYINLSRREERATMAQKLVKAGEANLAEIIRRL